MRLSLRIEQLDPNHNTALPPHMHLNGPDKPCHEMQVCHPAIRIVCIFMQNHIAATITSLYLLLGKGSRMRDSGLQLCGLDHQQN